MSCSATDVAPSLSRIYGCIQTWSESGSLSAEDEAYEIYLTDEDVLESKCWGESCFQQEAAVGVRFAAPLLLIAFLLVSSPGI